VKLSKIVKYSFFALLFAKTSESINFKVAVQTSSVSNKLNEKEEKTVSTYKFEKAYVLQNDRKYENDGINLSNLGLGNFCICYKDFKSAEMTLDNLKEKLSLCHISN